MKLHVIIIGVILVAMVFAAILYLRILIKKNDFKSQIGEYKSVQPDPAMVQAIKNKSKDRGKRS